MADCVLDSSAVLALLFREPGHDVVTALAAQKLISSVNLGEVFTRLVERTGSLEISQSLVLPLRLSTIDHSKHHAAIVASLRPVTRDLGLSYGDRACLSLAIERQLPVLTTDRVWSQLSLGIDIRVIR